MHAADKLNVKFRCARELEQILPRPVQAVRGLPEWFKAMPQSLLSTISNKDVMTVKKCPPFIDAMTYGFLMPLVADLTVKDGELSWSSGLPAVASLPKLTRSPIDYHENVQVKGTPFFNDDQFIIKFNNFWSIELPPGYSLFVTHPVNRPDLPFTTITGLVDSDRYVDSFIHFPARWTDPKFSGVLPKGTPVAQCLPIRREAMVEEFEVLSEEAVQRLRDTGRTLSTEANVYRREFRAPKR